MTPLTAALLFGGGIAAGVINAMAGGGSLLTVPLLSLAGVGGLLANGTNRVAVLLQNVSSGYGYAHRGVVPWSAALLTVGPAVLGGVAGSAVVSQLDDALFERLFGVLMIPLLILALWQPATSTRRPWPTWLIAVSFVAIGFYAGSIQAGAGIIILLALNRAGYDLVVANALKTLVILGVTAIAVPIFLLNGQVRIGPALVLAAGMAMGGYLGSQIAVDGGERVIRPVLVVSVVALAGRMLGLYG